MWCSAMSDEKAREPIWIKYSDGNRSFVVQDAAQHELGGERSVTLVQLNWICWGIFCLVWVIGATYNLYKAPATLQKRFSYDWLLLVVLVWVVLYCVPHRYLAFVTFHVSWLHGIGAILLLASTLFTLWARWVLGKMWASIAAVKKDHQLVTNGPYRITRHPIYTGILGMILGSALSTGEGSIFLGFLAALLVFLNRIRIEEQLMTKTFGDEYLQYKKRVPRLMPGFKWID
jgi:protein-S-isoprenylcysteine O-methyltransferase Ste14